jgi:hypothetical protein
MSDGAPKNGHGTRASGQKVLSLAEARRAAKDSGQYVLWLNEKQAREFSEPGWIKRDPAHEGGVLFVHPAREIRAARQRGIL